MQADDDGVVRALGKFTEAERRQFMIQRHRLQAEPIKRALIVPLSRRALICLSHMLVFLRLTVKVFDEIERERGAKTTSQNK